MFNNNKVKGLQIANVLYYQHLLFFLLVITYCVGGRSVEYSSTVVSANKIAFIPLLQTAFPQNRQSSCKTCFFMKVGCNDFLGIFIGKF